jgi:predicted dienelactone hydrolase
MRSSDPDLHHARPLRGTSHHAPGEEGIHLMGDTTSADVGTGQATPIISVRPVTLAVPDRGQDLQVRVSAPTTGHDLPVVVFSHGMTLSMDNYAPLADLRTALGLDDGAWPAAREALAATSDPLGRIDSK